MILGRTDAIYKSFSSECDDLFPAGKHQPCVGYRFAVRYIRTEVTCADDGTTNHLLRFQYVHKSGYTPIVAIEHVCRMATKSLYDFKKKKFYRNTCSSPDEP